MSPGSRELAVVGLDGFLGHEVGRNVGDVVTVVSRLGPARVAGLEALGACLRAGGQRVDLHTRVVVVKLAVNVPALGRKQVADRVAERRLPAVAHVQRPGRVGRDKLDHHAARLVHRLDAVLPGRRQHLAHGFLLGRRLEPEVDEARPGDFHRIDPALVSRRRQQRLAQALGELARVELERFGQLHGGRGREVAMGGDLGRLESGLLAGTGGQLVQLSGQDREQFLFD